MWSQQDDSCYHSWKIWRMYLFWYLAAFLIVRSPIMKTVTHKTEIQRAKCKIYAHCGPMLGGRCFAIGNPQWNRHSAFLRDKHTSSRLVLGKVVSSAAKRAVQSHVLCQSKHTKSTGTKNARAFQCLWNEYVASQTPWKAPHWSGKNLPRQPGYRLTAVFHSKRAHAVVVDNLLVIFQLHRKQISTTISQVVRQIRNTHLNPVKTRYICFSGFKTRHLPKTCMMLNMPKASRTATDISNVFFFFYWQSVFNNDP